MGTRLAIGLFQFLNLNDAARRDGDHARTLRATLAAQSADIWREGLNVLAVLDQPPNRRDPHRRNANVVAVLPLRDGLRAIFPLDQDKARFGQRRAPCDSD